MAILGMWMWPQSVRLHGAEKVVSYCARAKVTDIYFLSKGLGGTTAFHGPHAPHDCRRDLLQELLCAAHQKGIRVHAWFTSACDDHYKQLHPESGRCHLYRGRDRELISLADEKYLEYMEHIVRDVCRRYEIDGLHLDYIRYNHMLYGWGEEDVARYEAAGADGERLRALMDQAYRGEERKESLLLDAARSGDKDLLAYAQVRRRDVWHFAQTLCHIARQEKPSITLSAALMPEGAYPDPTYANLHYGQSYEDAARLYDYVLPMAYSKAYENKDGAWVRDVAVWTMGYGMKAVVGLHAYEGGTGKTLRDDIAALRDLPIHGICLFREGATALAFAEDNALCVYNPLEEPITHVTAAHGCDTIMLDGPIQPGKEKAFPLPFRADGVQVFTPSGEASVYLTK